MKLILALFAGFLFGAAISASVAYATTENATKDPIAPVARAMNALVDTIAETDPTSGSASPRTWKRPENEAVAFQ